jgi:GST-like protein
MVEEWMIELYGVASPNVYKVSIMLEEAGLDYAIKYVDVMASQQFDPDFIRISPANKVPAIIDHDTRSGTPISVCESGAILIYLAEKTGLLLSADAAIRAETLQWLMIQMASIGPMFGQYLHFLFFAPDNHYGKSRYQAQAMHLLAMLDTKLGQTEYISGNTYSIADIAILPWVKRATELFPWLTAADSGGLAQAHPHLHRWYETVMQRAGVRAGIARLDTLVGQTTKSMDDASAEGLDQFLLRNNKS